MVAGLARRFGDLDIAEDAAAEAFATAAERWPRDGIPPNPGGVAHHHRDPQGDRPAPPGVPARRKHQAAHMCRRRRPAEPTGPVDDDRLRLVFTCCHPALAMEARVALTLRLVGGLTVAEIARAFLVQETHDGAADHPRQGQDPGGAHPLPRAVGDGPARRLAGVLAVVYLVFNEGYLAARVTTPSAPTSRTRRSGLARLLRGPAARTTAR